MKIIYFFILGLVLGGCLSDFDRHPPYQSPELLPIFLELQDSLAEHEIFIDVLSMEITLKPNLGKRGEYNFFTKSISIDQGWFHRMVVDCRIEVLATCAHELGHSLGLPHLRNEEKNIMSINRPAMKDGRTMSNVYDELEELLIK